MSRENVIGDGYWVFGGQIVSGIGALVGIRLLTEVLSPSIFGAFSLVLGIVLLAVNMSVSPIGQYILYDYGRFDKKKELGLLHEIVLYKTFRHLGLIGLSLLVGLYFMLDDSHDRVYIIIFSLLFFCFESAKVLLQSYANAKHEQRAFSIMSMIEAWSKPLLALLAVYFISSASSVVLAGYSLGAAVSVVYIASVLFSRNDLYIAFFGPKTAQREDMLIVLKSYIAPLLPLALVGWVNGLGDRYIIGGVLSLAEVGLYTAVYGLISRPFLIWGRSLEVMFRPYFQDAVSKADSSSARRILIIWISVCALGLLLGVNLIYFFSNLLAGLFLGDAFRSASHLMIWIAIGYSFLVLSYIFERICYAYGNTGEILKIQAIGGLCSLVLAFLGTIYFGLLGAAVAVSGYFLIQLVVSVIVTQDFWKVEVLR